MTAYMHCRLFCFFACSVGCLLPCLLAFSLSLFFFFRLVQTRTPRLSAQQAVATGVSQPTGVQVPSFLVVHKVHAFFCFFPHLSFFFMELRLFTLSRFMRHENWAQKILFFCFFVELNRDRNAAPRPSTGDGQPVLGYLSQDILE